MGNLNFYQEWLADILFWLGFCLSIFGAFLLLAPVYAVACSHKLNRWFSTDAFFQGLDKPRFQDRFFYRWHRSFGFILLFSSGYIFYMLALQTDVHNVADILPLVKDPNVNEWFYQALQYFLLAASALIAIVGIIVFVRPSALKHLETKANTWYQTGRSLRKLDASYDIPERILPGNVRLFGTLVLMGGLYIMSNTLLLGSG